MVDVAERPTIAGRPWLAQYDRGDPATLDHPAVRLDALLRWTAERYPDRSALIFFGRRTSYRALDEAVDRVWQLRQASNRVWGSTPSCAAA